MMHAATAAAVNGACNHPISQIQWMEDKLSLHYTVYFLLKNNNNTHTKSDFLDFSEKISLHENQQNRTACNIFELNVDYSLI